MAKKNKTPTDPKPHTEEMETESATIFSSNEVTLFDLGDSAEKKSEKHKETTGEDLTIKFNLPLKDSLELPDSSLPKKDEKNTSEQSFFGQDSIERNTNRETNQDNSTITFLHSSNNEIIFKRIDKSTHEELEDLFEDIPTPSYLFDNDAVDFNKDTQLITRKTEDVETQAMPIIHNPLISKSVKDLFPSNDVKIPSAEAGDLSRDVVQAAEEEPHLLDTKDTILISSDTSLDDINNKQGDSSSSKTSKETLDISKLNPTETLDELLEETSDNKPQQESSNFLSDIPNISDSFTANDEDDDNLEDSEDKDRESLLFKNNLKYDLDRDVSDMMTKPFKRTSGYELPKRYTYTELLGLGGMGEVIRVKDDVLRRYVAMKIIRQDFATHNVVLSRFREEAQITAQLCHPNIIPVYELGKLPDGRSFFTMKEVDGDTLDDVIADLHLATKVLPQESEIPVWGESDQGFAFRDVIDIFHRVCVAIAYAHTQGVIHRDLKPENIMIGSFGEVLVMDWGIAKVLESNTSRNLPEINISNRRQTRMGAVSGTPSYMSKEQALGIVSEIGTHSDVFSLGIILYEILNGKPPFLGSPQSVLEQARKGENVPSIRPPAPVPEGLIQIMKKATQPDWKDRYPTAKEFSDDLRKWMIGLEKKAKGRKKVKDALEKEKELQTLQETYNQIAIQKYDFSHQVPDNASLDQKHKLWAMEDQERNIRIKLVHLEQEMLQMLRSALTYDPNLTEALQALADYHYKRHNALSIDQSVEAEKHLVELAYYDQGKYHNYLSGDGQCHLQTNTTATVSLYRFSESDRRLISVFERDVGTTPLTGISLSMGSYLLQLKAPNYEILHLPIHIPRGDIYMNKNPISGMIEPIQLLERDTIEDSESYIPGGWCIQGTISNKLNPYRKIWVKSFVIKKFPVTNREYIQFLNDISQHEGFDIANQFVNREMDGSLIYATRDNGHFMEFFIENPSEVKLMETRPVVGITCYQAEKYAEWYAKHTGKSWRLPTTTEWEKSALGVDGRLYPWGNHLETTYLHMRADSSNDHGTTQSTSVDSFPLDCSVYGVRGMAGNVQDWCTINASHIENNARNHAEQDRFYETNAALRGGSWKQGKVQLLLKTFSISAKSIWTETTSIRLARDIE